jgi:hemolysin III
MPANSSRYPGVEWSRTWPAPARRTTSIPAADPAVPTTTAPASGWVAVVALPQLVQYLGMVGTVLLAGGGLAYSAGALVYARRRPNPAPAVFGYHEVFHLLVVGGVALHFAAVTLAVLAA